MDLSELNAIPVDVEALSSGAFDDIVCTIVDMEMSEGGEERQNADGSTFTTRNQLVFKLRIDEGADAEFTWQRFNLPKAYKGPDGKVRPVRPSDFSAWGIFTKELEKLGVSQNATYGQVYTVNGGAGDLLGLTFRRELKKFPSFRAGETTAAFVPTEVIAFDNAVRQAAGLAPASLNALV